jgi:hypothetical protein
MTISFDTPLVPQTPQLRHTAHNERLGADGPANEFQVHLTSVTIMGPSRVSNFVDRRSTIPPAAALTVAPTTGGVNPRLAIDSSPPFRRAGD